MNRRVLSIQSSVVHGYVGNKAATLPLQMNNIEVDPFNTCQYSNHAGYPTFPGRRTEGDELNAVMKGLTDNHMKEQITDLLFGYMGSESLIFKAAEVAAQLKQENPNVFFLCDPVMGDNGQLYVPASFVTTYKDKLIQLADVITPNQTELELLSGMKIKTLEDVAKACQYLHSKGPKIIVITSAHLDRDPADTAPSSSTSSSSSSSSLSQSLSNELQEEKTCPLVHDFVYLCPVDDVAPFVKPSSSSSSSSSTSQSNSTSPLPDSTSVPLGVDKVGLHPIGLIHVIASIACPNDVNQSSNTSRLFHLRVPRYKSFISGTGDVAAALLLTRLNAKIVRGQSLSSLPPLPSSPSPSSSSSSTITTTTARTTTAPLPQHPFDVTDVYKHLQESVESAMSSMSDLLRRTIAARRGELLLVQSKECYVKPISKAQGRWLQVDMTNINNASSDKTTETAT